MTTATTLADGFRGLAEAEAGLPVSAGARPFHVQAARASGRVISVDLSDVPEGKRAEVVAAIRDLIGRARQGEGVQQPRPASKVGG